MPKIWDVLGYAYYAGDDVERSEAVCRKALEMSPGTWRTRVTLAAILAKRGDLAGAAQAYREALKSSPGNPVLLQGLELIESKRIRPALP